MKVDSDVAYAIKNKHNVAIRIFMVRITIFQVFHISNATDHVLHNLTIFNNSVGIGSKISSWVNF